MAVVETVRGPIDTTALGRVVMHEHVFVLGAEFRQNYPGFPDQWDAVAAAVPNWNYNHISDDVLPALRERGVSEDQITTMLVDNPRCYFEVTK